MSLKTKKRSCGFEPSNRAYYILYVSASLAQSALRQSHNYKVVSLSLAQDIYFNYLLFKCRTNKLLTITYLATDPIQYICNIFLI